MFKLTTLYLLYFICSFYYRPVQKNAITLTLVYYSDQEFADCIHRYRIQSEPQ